MVENILITTIALHDYSSLYETDDKVEKNILVMLKVADFGLVRAIADSPPYTECVCVRWYRAPGEVILKSRHYTAAIDTWALGCIVMELITLFPGKTEIDQMNMVSKIKSDSSGARVASGSPTGAAGWLHVP